jgi:hypothetical protein
MPRLSAFALILMVSLPAQAQIAPDYTFGPAFGNGFNAGSPQGYSGGRGLQMPPLPGGYYNGLQSPFLTMPAFPANGPTRGIGSGPMPQTAPPLTQPLPYWMQTPPPARPQARFIDEVPTASRRAPQARPQSAPPRWAPLSGPMPVIQNHMQAGNNWRATPTDATSATAQRLPVTPPKWHTD